MASIADRGNGTFRAQLCVARKRTSKTFQTREEAVEWISRIEPLKKLEAKKLRRSTEESLLSLIPSRMLDAIGKIPHTVDQIVNNAFPYELGSGIYFLIRDFKVMYVGKSVNVLGRLCQHRREGRRTFDSFNVILCSPDRLDELEEAYIVVLMPRWNRSISRRPQIKRTNSVHQKVLST